jgi:hypothetical protein
MRSTPNPHTEFEPSTARHQDTVHDPALADLRAQVASRLQIMNAMHAHHAWERRHRDPIAAHALAFFYADPGGRPNRWELRTGTRLFLDGPDVTDLPRLLYGLTQLARGYRGERAGFDPRAQMADVVEPMSAQATYFGLGISTLDTPRNGDFGGPWHQVREQVDSMFNIPGRCFAQLVDNTLILADRRGEDELGEFYLQSSQSLDVVPGQAIRRWRMTSDLLLRRDPATAGIWQWLEQLHETCWQADHAR